MALGFYFLPMPTFRKSGSYVFAYYCIADAYNTELSIYFFVQEIYTIKKYNSLTVFQK